MELNGWGILYILMFVLTVSFAFACNPYWVSDPISCRTNDTYIKTYTDLNNCSSTNYPYDYGTEASCNYCSDSIQQSFGACVNGTQAISWIDPNYYSCCLITNLSSDCGFIYSPFNETTTQPCFWDNLSMELGQLSCQTQPNIGIRDKEYCIAHIPLNYSNETFRCIAIIKNGYTNEVIQTTPEYRETSQTFFNLYPDADTRQWFTPANNIVNFYYTGKNLNPDNDYILTIECSSSQRTLTSQMQFQIAYEDVSFVFFRTKWLMANAPYIIGGIILLFILIVVIWLILKGMF